MPTKLNTLRSFLKKIGDLGETQNQALSSYYTVKYDLID